MNRKLVFFLLGMMFLLLIGCDDESRKTTSADPMRDSDEEPTVEEQSEFEEPEKVEEFTNQVREREDELVSSHSDEIEAERTLDDYSSEEIEYARVWLQLGPNQEIDQLYVNHISEGESIHPHIETSATYPEDVIQLTGSRLIDGSVTYSGNGDGTINVYHVPQRWETNTPKDLKEEDMRIYTESIIENTELIYIEPENDEDVIELIEKIEMGP